MICRQVTVASVFVPSPVSCVRPLCRCQLTARGVCAASRSTLISPLAKRRILPRKRWLCNCQKHGGRAQLSAAMCVKVTGHTVESIKFYSEQERGKKMATTHKHIPEMRVQLKMPHPHCVIHPFSSQSWPLTMLHLCFMSPCFPLCVFHSSAPRTRCWRRQSWMNRPAPSPSR